MPLGIFNCFRPPSLTLANAKLHGMQPSFNSGGLGKPGAPLLQEFYESPGLRPGNGTCTQYGSPAVAAATSYH